ncbi:MAG: HEAT repeat domain-containing protein, partial [Planctomycetes bacterium]|nr:HEAT repeat domain-containing protein [Planctomycetota bacterium]
RDALAAALSALAATARADDDARAEALRLLGRLGGAAANALLTAELARAEAPLAMRQAAVLALADRPPAEIAPALLPLARDRAASLAGVYAAFTLARAAQTAGDEATLAALRELAPALEANLLDDRDPQLAGESVVALAALSDRDTDAVLLGLLRDRPDPSLRRRAADRLAENGQPDALDALRDLARRELDPAVRAAIEAAVAAISARVGLAG